MAKPKPRYCPHCGHPDPNRTQSGLCRDKRACMERAWRNPGPGLKGA